MISWLALIQAVVTFFGVKGNVNTAREDDTNRSEFKTNSALKESDKKLFKEILPEVSKRTSLERATNVIRVYGSIILF